MEGWGKNGVQSASVLYPNSCYNESCYIEVQVYNENSWFQMKESIIFLVIIAPLSSNDPLSSFCGKSGQNFTIGFRPLKFVIDCPDFIFNILCLVDIQLS